MNIFRIVGTAALVALFSLFASVGASQAVPLGPLTNADGMMSKNIVGELIQPVHYRRYLHCHTRLVRRCRVRNIRRCVRWRRGRCTRRVWRRVWRCRRVPRTYCHKRGIRVRVR